MYGMDEFSLQLDIKSSQIYRKSIAESLGVESLESLKIFRERRSQGKIGRLIKLHFEAQTNYLAPKIEASISEKLHLVGGSSKRSSSKERRDLTKETIGGVEMRPGARAAAASGRVVGNLFLPSVARNLHVDPCFPSFHKPRGSPRQVSIR